MDSVPEPSLLTKEKILEMRRLLTQADMVMMETLDGEVRDIKVIEHKLDIDYIDVMKSDIWKNPLSPALPGTGHKQKHFTTQSKRVAKRKAQKLARRINRNK